VLAKVTPEQEKSYLMVLRLLSRSWIDLKAIPTGHCRW